MRDVNSSKPKSEPNAVPLGVKLITNGIAFKPVTSSQLCAKGKADAVRNDAGKMCIEFFLEWAMFGGTLKTIMRKRGWIKVPPYYFPPGFMNK